MSEIGLMWLGAGGLIALAIGGAVYSENKWDEFSAKHECKIVGKMEGSHSTGYGMGANGQGGIVTTYTPGKTGYACNDGVTYWR